MTFYSSLRLRRSAHRSWLRSQPFCVAWVFASTDTWMTSSSITAGSGSSGCFPGFHSFSRLLSSSRESKYFSLKDLFFEINGLRSLDPFVPEGEELLRIRTSAALGSAVLFGLNGRLPRVTLEYCRFGITSMTPCFMGSGLLSGLGRWD